MKIAVIDLGTNTFHLMVVEMREGKTETLYSEKRAVKIGQGGINEGIITPEAESRAIRCLLDYNKILRDLGTHEVYALATSAFRNARNGVALANRLEQETGIKIKIIGGEEEATWIYEGVRSGISLGKHKSLIMDIGGGSVEFILCNEEKIFWKKSYEIGGQRLMERFHTTDPMPTESVKALEMYLQTTLVDLNQTLDHYRPEILIGSSGSFDTLSEMNILRRAQNYDLESSKEYTLSRADFEYYYSLLLQLTRDERMRVPGMIELRVDMIVVAAVMIQYVMQLGAFESIRCSTQALKEGILSAIQKGDFK